MEFETAIMSIKGKLDYFQILDYEKKVIIYIATAVIFVVTLIFLRKDNSKGYQDATWHGVHGNSRFFEPQELRELGYASDEKNSKYNPKNPFVALEAEEGIICGVEKDKKQMLII
ncbi:hypothetical protein, partial [Enterococcus faecalis]|uniref:hypothetical protein n=1 Tax=Enterococcus faecalis TaxID=1351 RepID=UPI001BA8C07A